MFSDNLKRNIFTGCEHPKNVRNPYTGEIVTVPCGKCKSCVQLKATKYSTLCALEQSGCVRSFFCTLTYANFYAPRFILQPVVSMEQEKVRDFDAKKKTLVISENKVPYAFRMLNVSKHTGSVGDFLGTYECDDKELNDLKKKCNLHGQFTYLRYSDIQNFLKRVRKRYNKECGGKLRFFAIGEYGPRTYRCHWHIIFYLYESESDFTTLVRKSWKFGRVDISAIYGGASTYVAGYVNSIVGTPRLLQCRGIRPRVFHSFFLGTAPFQANEKEIFEDPFGHFAKTSYRLGNKYVRLRMPSQVERKIFPKCYAFSTLGYSELQRSYTLYDSFVQSTGACGMRPILSLIREFFDNGCISINIPNFEQFISDCHFIARIIQCPERILYDKDYLRITVYFIMRQSFIYYSAHGRSVSPVRRIVEYYKYDKPQDNLKSFYRSQEEYSEINLSSISGPEDDKDGIGPFAVFYDNIDYDKKDNPYYQSLVESSWKRFNDKIKHRELYDANNAFNYNQFESIFYE